MNIISLRKPVVYDGPADEEAIHETFMQWREPCQQDLTDTNFEHLTQASVEFNGSSCLFHETINDIINLFSKCLFTIDWQASSGATTGDWLVHFFRDDCDDCHKLDARLETVACKHKGRINVARMNKGSTGAVTGRRMGVTNLPSLVL